MKIELHEAGMRIAFRVNEDQTVELVDFSAAADAAERFANGVTKTILTALKPANAENELVFALAGAAPIRRREGLFRYAVIIKLVRTANTAAAINAIYAFSDGCADECYRGIEVNPQDML